MAKALAKKTKRTRYSQEYKAEALQLAEKFGVASAPRQLRHAESQLYNWRAKARAAQSRSEREQTQAVEIARLKRQLAEREELRGAVFEYIETDYSRIRRHSALGYRGPVAFEAAQSSLAAVSTVRG